MKVLVACEESQTVCNAFREMGHEAYSCDLQPCSGGHPEWHIQDDVLRVIDGYRKVVFTADCILEDWDDDCEMPVCPNCLIEYSECNCPGPTQDDEFEYAEFNGILYARPINKPYWDLMIAHPPCTDLAVSGALYFEQKRNDGRMKKSIEFFMSIASADIKHICIENPVGIMSTFYRKPDQIIQPYFFGEDASKKTCLWLKNLPLLKPTKYIEPTVTDNGKKIWSNQTISGQNKLGPSPDRAKIRSKTYEGIATAMSVQWNDISGYDFTQLDLFQ